MAHVHRTPPTVGPAGHDLGAASDPRSQADADAARDYARAYLIEREAYEHLFTAGAGLAKASITPELAVGFDVPPEKLLSAPLQ